MAARRLVFKRVALSFNPFFSCRTSHTHIHSCYLWGALPKKLQGGAIEFIDMHNNDCNRSSDAFVAKTKHGGSLHCMAGLALRTSTLGR